MLAPVEGHEVRPRLPACVRACVRACVGAVCLLSLRVQACGAAGGVHAAWQRQQQSAAVAAPISLLLLPGSLPATARLPLPCPTCRRSPRRARTS